MVNLKLVYERYRQDEQDDVSEGINVTRERSPERNIYATFGPYLHFPESIYRAALKNVHLR